METRVVACGALISPAAASSGFNGMAKELASAALRARIQRVAVLPFISGGDGDSREGWNIAEKLVTPLVRTGKVQAVERQLIERLLDEQRLGLSGALDETRLLAFGKISAAQGIVTGSYITEDTKVVINARLIDAETGLIIAACEQKIDRAAIGLVDAPEFPAPWETAARLAERTAAPVLFQAPSAGEVAGLACDNARARADRLEAQVLDLKARYWARKLRKDPALDSAEASPEGMIYDPTLKREYQDKLSAWIQSRHIPRLSKDEVRRFVAVDREAFSLNQQCGS